MTDSTSASAGEPTQDPQRPVRPYAPEPHGPEPFASGPPYAPGVPPYAAGGPYGAGGPPPTPTPAPADFTSPDADYTYPAGAPASGYPAGGYPAPVSTPGYAGYGAYGGYGTQPPLYAVVAPVQKTNGLAIGSMVTSIAGVALLMCYGIGAIVGLVGAILGHVARRQIRDRNEAGGGMALAGVIVGWIALALGVLIVGIVIFAIAMSSNFDVPDQDPQLNNFKAMRLLFSA